jgi:uroporphyrinogen III methyltransferase/synthase
MSALGGTTDLHGARVACIGPKTAETARATGLKVDIMATESTIASMVDAIEGYFLKEK